MRSLGDVAAWFAQPYTGTVETSGAAWWRLLDRFAPGARIAVVRRPVDEVVASLMAIPGVSFEPDTLHKAMLQADHKLDQLVARVPGVLSLEYGELDDEEACARLFKHCLPYEHDRAHWLRLDATLVETDFRALTRYCHAYRPAMERLASIAKNETLTMMVQRAPVAPDGVTFHVEPFATWLRDARALIERHLVLVDEFPEAWQGKNLDLMQGLDDAGNMQIVTARANGRMFGYLMTLVSPSLTSSDVTTGTNTTFFADPAMPGLGMKMQRYAMARLAERGVTEVFMEAGTRASGPRIDAIFRRLGARRHGEVYRLQLSGN